MAKVEHLQERQTKAKEKQRPPLKSILTTAAANPKDLIAAAREVTDLLYCR